MKPGKRSEAILQVEVIANLLLVLADTDADELVPLALSWLGKRLNEAKEVLEGCGA